MHRLQQLRSELRALPRVPLKHHTYAFKTGPGAYAQQERFLGLTVPALRKLAKCYKGLNRSELKVLLYSPYNEERLLALFILIHQYEQSDDQGKHSCFEFYLEHVDQVNNWNLVDSSAHWIIGAYLYETGKHYEQLEALIASPSLWRRRVGIVATWMFIRKNELEWTFKLAERLLCDPEDLMHKATGWMLREAGKRDEGALRQFLNKYATRMPRTLLRYAIERLDPGLRKRYLGMR